MQAKHLFVWINNVLSQALVRRGGLSLRLLIAATTLLFSVRCCDGYPDWINLRSSELFQMDLKDIVLGELLGSGSKNIVISTGDKQMALRMCISVQDDHPFSYTHGGVYSVLAQSNDPLVKKVVPYLLRWNQSDLRFDMAAYRTVKDELYKAHTFCTTPNLLLHALPITHHWDIDFNTPVARYDDQDRPISLVATFQLSRRMTGDIASRIPEEWKPLDLQTLLHGYYQTQNTALTATGYYHSDGHPHNLLYNTNTTPITIYMSDLGFSSGHLEQVHNGSVLHSGFIKASNQLFDLIALIAKQGGTQFKATRRIVSNAYTAHNASKYSLSAQEYFSSMQQTIESEFVKHLSDEALLTYVQSGEKFGLIKPMIIKFRAESDAKVHSLNQTLQAQLKEINKQFEIEKKERQQTERILLDKIANLSALIQLSISPV